MSKTTISTFELFAPREPEPVAGDVIDAMLDEWYRTDPPIPWRKSRAADRYRELMANALAIADRMRGVEAPPNITRHEWAPTSDNGWACIKCGIREREDQSRGTGSQLPAPCPESPPPPPPMRATLEAEVEQLRKIEVAAKAVDDGWGVGTRDRDKLIEHMRHYMAELHALIAEPPK